MAGRRIGGVAFHQSRHPPAPRFFGLGRIAHIDAAVNLVVGGVAGLEIGRPGGAMDVFAIDKPQLVNAHGMGPGTIEKGDRLRIFRIGNIEQLDARRMKPEAGGQGARLGPGLVGNRHDIAAHLEAVGAHAVIGDVALDNHLGVFRIGDVDAGEVLRRPLMGQPHDAAPAGGFLDRHTLADAAPADERVMGEQFHIECFVAGH